MKPLWILLVLATAAGYAQTTGTRPPAKKTATKAAPKKDAAPAAAPTKWPIESLRVEGNRNYTADQVLAVARLKVGEVAGKPEFDAARDRLVASGAFETVGYRFEPGASQQGYSATFQVTEVAPAYPVQYEELGVPATEIEAVLKAKDPLYANRMPASRAVVDRYVSWIEEFLTAKGVPEKIAGVVTQAAPEQFTIVFRPAKNLPAVAQVTFAGNQVLPQNVLREAIAPVAIGSPYTEAGFRELLNGAIRAVYEQRGRVRVTFPKIRTEPATDVQGLHVFVTVDEGQSYELGKVVIAGPSPIDPAVLVKEGDFKSGDVANFDRVGEGLERIRKAVRRAGYLQVKVTSDRKIDDAKKAVDVAVHVAPGPLYLMGKLEIVGLPLDGEAEVRRIWTLKEGNALNPEYPDYFLGRIKADGVFDGLGKTKADQKVDEKNHVVDVTLTFTSENPDQKPGRRTRRQ
ncbi:MAG TPA: POTRA domain-containing protein [Candidatus Acidoferrales bacterium]|nr:POTRA domain-containing protein [Candidatus Acidoferrales bacterium]